MSAGYMRRCARKKRFETKPDAQAARTSLAADRTGPVNTYRCDQCLGWHVGNAGGFYITRNRNGKRPNKRMRGRQ